MVFDKMKKHLSAQRLPNIIRSHHWYVYERKHHNIPTSHITIRSFNMCRGERIVVYYYYNYILYYIILYNINILLSIFLTSLGKVEGA